MTAAPEGCQAGIAGSASGGKPHPAELRSKALMRHFTKRDRFEHIPDMPNDLEADILIKMLTAYSTSLSGETPAKKLASLRCMWWGWCDGVHWTQIRQIRPEGKAALERWLIAAEAAGDERATKVRRRWFATAAEKEADRIKGAAEQRKHDALHALRVQGIDLAQEETTLNHHLRDLALQIGRGANNLDDLLIEIRLVTQRIDEIEAEGQRLDAERQRIKQEGVA